MSVLAAQAQMEKTVVRGGDKKGRPEYVSVTERSEMLVTGSGLFRSVCSKLVHLLVTRRKMFDFQVGMLWR